MGGRKRGRCRKRKSDRDANESSSSKKPKNDNHIEETMQFGKTPDDASVLFSLFPEEIWSLITDKVVDSGSLNNLMQASPVFRNLLLPRRVEFLFPQVWKALGVKFERLEGKVYLSDIDEMYPHRDLRRFPNGKKLWCSRILTLRMVCQSWCRGVDEFYENLPDRKHYRMPADPENAATTLYSRGIRMYEWIDIVNHLDSNAIIEEFIEHFEITHFETGNQRNPLIGRNLRISYGLRGHENGIFSLLSKYGQHFWFCDLYLSDQFRTRVECYSDLKEMLKLMPNLKTLKVTYSGKRSDYTIFFGESYLYPDEIRQLEQEIASQPLPKLHKLTFLSVKDFPATLFNPLVLANNHISMLEIQRDNVPVYDIYTFPMPRLKQLSIQYYSKTDFENLYKPEVNWPLEKLYLNFKKCPFMPWSQIFTLLESKWATTLKNVAIYFPPIQREYSNDTNVIDDGSSTKLNLPNVQRFKFTAREMFSLDFILQMKKLKNLEITVDVKRIDDVIEKQLRLIEKNQVIQFVGYFQRFTESNIWNLFPNLKQIRVGKPKGYGLYIFNREQCGAKRNPRYTLWYTYPTFNDMIYGF